MQKLTKEQQKALHKSFNYYCGPIEKHHKDYAWNVFQRGLVKNELIDSNENKK